MKKGHTKKNRSPKIVPDFIQIPYQVFTDEVLSSTDKFVYGAIYFFYNTTIGKKCTASNETIADLIKTTRPTVGNSLVVLESRGFINRVFVDNKKKRRKEIIPLVVVTKLQKNRSRVKPESYSITPEYVKPESYTVKPESYTVKPESYTDDKNPEITNNKAITELSRDLDPISVKPQSEESNSIGRIERKNIKLEVRSGASGPAALNIFPDHSFTDHLESLKRVKKLADIPHKEIVDSIATFLKVFPGEFINGDPFANKTTRRVVGEILMRLTPDEFKVVVDQYAIRKTEKFCPGGGRDIFEFCKYKFVSIEDYFKKSEGGLHAHKSISTPGQSQERDAQYKKRLDVMREQDRKDEEEWKKNNPKQ